MTTNPVFCFDMDGTIADLYAVENWLDALRSFSDRPYREAAPMMNFSALARQLNAAQRKGAKLASVATLCSMPTFVWQSATGLQNICPLYIGMKSTLYPMARTKPRFAVWTA